MLKKEAGLYLLKISANEIFQQSWLSPSSYTQIFRPQSCPQNTTVVNEESGGLPVQGGSR